MILSWEDFLTGHSPKEHELDGSGSFMLFPMLWCFGWTWGCSPFHALCCVGATGVGRAAGQLSRTRWEVAEGPFLVFGCWQIPYHIGYPWREVAMMEENGLSCWTEFSYFFNSCAKKKKKKSPPKSLILLGINFCVFSESTDKGYKSRFIFQKGEELKPECETSWCCSILPEWPWAGQTVGLEMSKSVTGQSKMLTHLDMLYQHYCASLNCCLVDVTALEWLWFGGWVWNKKNGVSV